MSTKGFYPPDIFLARLFFPLLIVLLGTAAAGAQNSCSCTNCPQALFDNFQDDFYIQVENALNPELGQNGQGVCGVVLHFDHEYLGDLSITLTSPAGQSVTLVGPNGFFGETDGTSWDVTFVACNSNSDPDPGFQEVWSNDQAWGLFGNYSGSYYPASGCLEAFNTGPVNGQWTLSVTDVQMNDVGNFYGYEILFCDPAGIDCVSCAADPGNLLQSDITGCLGDSALILNLSPYYAPAQPPPPDSLYQYVYIISAGGVIVKYDSVPDLSNLPLGTYSVCGFSYLKADEPEVPQPDDTLTVVQLTSLLNSSSPPFCGKITSNCVNVTIQSPVPDIMDSDTICAPNCFNYYGQVFCDSGEHNVTIVQDGCTVTATLHLTVLPPVIDTLYETICAGSCAQTPGFQSACSEGEYQKSLPGSNGCDSSTLLILKVLEVEAAIASPPAWPCAQSPLLLTGSSLSNGGQTTSFYWFSDDGGTFQGPVDQMNAAANSAGDYSLQVCVAEGGATCCDTATVSVQPESSSPPPPPTGVFGNPVLCPGDTLRVWTKYDSSGNTRLLWSIPSDWILLDSMHMDTIRVVGTNVGASDLCVRTVNACDTSDAVCISLIVLSLPDMAPALLGPDTSCTGEVVEYRVIPDSPGLDYVWTVTSGVLQLDSDSTLAKVIWDDAADSGRVCAWAQNVCGSGPETCLDVVLQKSPKAFAGPDAEHCGDSLRLQAQLSNPANTGFWEIVSGPGPVIFQDSLNAESYVFVTLTGLYTLMWTEENPACRDQDLVFLQFNDKPVAGPEILICDSVNEFFTVEVPVQGGLGPYWANGASFPGNTYVSPPLPSGSPYAIAIRDTNGCEAPLLSGVFNCGCSSSAGQMPGQLLEVCAGQQIVGLPLDAPVPDANDTLLFVLYAGSADSIVNLFSQNASGIFGLEAGMVPDSVYYLAVVVGNKAGNGIDFSDPCLAVSNGQPVVFRSNPVAFAGTDTTLCGSSLVLNANAGPAGQWEIVTTPAGGGLQMSNPADPAAVVESAMPGQYRLVWTVSEKGCSSSDTLTLTFHPVPQIFALSSVCDPANEFYQVGFEVSGGTPPYTVNSIPLTGALFVSDFLPSGMPFDFQVLDANQCPSASVRDSFFCACSSQAGGMPLQVLAVCAGDSLVVSGNGDHLLDANDVLVYVLHDGAVDSLGKILALQTSGRFGMPAGALVETMYYVSAVAGNGKNGGVDWSDPCLSVSQGQPVIFKNKPDANAGIDQTICGDQIALAAGQSSGAGTWNLTSGPGTAVFSDPGLPDPDVEVDQPGDYQFQWTVSNGFCTAYDTVTVRFQELPQIDSLVKICLGLNATFAVQVWLTGGLPPYVVDGLPGALNGDVFLSLPLGNNTAYLFAVNDANGCKTPEITGSHMCFCPTSAGTMDTQVKTFCAGDPAVALWNANALLDADDTIRFVLHDRPDVTLGTVLAVNTAPVFSYNPAFDSGTTYYISAVCGNNAGGAIDWNDPCLSVAPGTPVVWRDLPRAYMSGDTNLCAGEMGLLTFTGSGAYPLQVLYYNDQDSLFALTIPDQTPVSVAVTPDSTAVYYLTGVLDSGQPACSNASFGDTVVLKVTARPNAGLGALFELCAGADTTLLLADYVQGEDSGGFWRDTSVPPLPFNALDDQTGVLQTAGLNSGDYAIQYTVSGQSVCPDDSSTVEIRIHPTPVADAGADQLLDCHMPMVSLGDAGASPDNIFVWRLLETGLVVGDKSVLVASASGNYLLTTMNAFGCSDSDTVNVDWLSLPPVIQSVRIDPVRCFGEQNGRIVVDSVSGGTTPFLYGLNDEPLSSSGIFINLKPDQYVVIVQDAYGCEWADTVEVKEPPELKIDLGQDIEAAFGDSVYLIIQTSVNAAALDTVVWTPLLDTSRVGATAQHILPLHSTKITATVRDTNGCETADDVVLVLRRDRRVFVPNAFRPESNGTNNKLHVNAGPEVARVVLFEIFDRWGERVFQVKEAGPEDDRLAWDGRFRREVAKPGVYVYQLVVQYINGEEEVFSGSITLFR